MHSDCTTLWVIPAVIPGKKEKKKNTPHKGMGNSQWNIYVLKRDVLLHLNPSHLLISHLPARGMLSGTQYLICDRYELPLPQLQSTAAAQTRHGGARGEKLRREEKGKYCGIKGGGGGANRKSLAGLEGKVKKQGKTFRTFSRWIWDLSIKRETNKNFKYLLALWFCSLCFWMIDLMALCAGKVSLTDTVRSLTSYLLQFINVCQSAAFQICSNCCRCFMVRSRASRTTLWRNNT